MPSSPMPTPRPPHHVYRYEGRFISKVQAQRLGALPSTRNKVSSEVWEGRRPLAHVKGYAKRTHLEVAAAMAKDRERRRVEYEARAKAREIDRARAEERRRVREEYPPEEREAPMTARAWSEMIDLPAVAFEDRLYDAFWDDYLEVADVDDADLYEGE